MRDTSWVAAEVCVVNKCTEPHFVPHRSVSMKETSRGPLQNRCCMYRTNVFEIKMYALLQVQRVFPHFKTLLS